MKKYFALILFTVLLFSAFMYAEYRYTYQPKATVAQAVPIKDYNEVVSTMSVHDAVNAKVVANDKVAIDKLTSQRDQLCAFAKTKKLTPDASLCQ